VLFYQRRPPTGSGPIGVHRHREEWGVCLFSLFGVAVDDPIKRGEAVLMHLPTLRHGGIQLRAMPKLAGAEVFRNLANALLDVVLDEVQRVAWCGCRRARTLFRLSSSWTTSADRSPRELRIRRL
jgi:hypothetical protein